MTNIAGTPRFISFDCYGTLIDMRFGAVTRTLMADRVPATHIDDFLRDFAACRLDAVLGAWKPYAVVLHDALEQVCRRWRVAFREADAARLYAAVPGFGPHPDVPAGLARLATRFPLVILSNAADEQIHGNVARLGAGFHAVFTAEQAQAYKPRFQAFEYMFDRLGCAPSDLMHVSSSFRYDLMVAHDLGIGMRVFVNRGHDPSLTAAYGCHEVADIGGVADLLGLA